MSAQEFGTVLINLLEDVRKFEKEVKQIDDNAFILDDKLDRKWKSLLDRHSNITRAIAALSSEQKTEFAKRYETQRNELTILMDKVGPLLTEKTANSKSIRDTARNVSIIGGVLAGVFTVGKVVMEVFDHMDRHRR